jgi:hypothetical protein
MYRRNHERTGTIVGPGAGMLQGQWKKNGRAIPPNNTTPARLPVPQLISRAMQAPTKKPKRTRKQGKGRRKSKYPDIMF